MADQVLGQPIEVTLGDGSVVKAPNMEEAFKIVSKMKEDTAAELRRQREQNEALTTERDTYRQQADAQRATREAATGGDKKNFDQNAYYQMLAVDPLAAQDYLFEARFGMKPQDLRDRVERLDGEVSVISQDRAAAAFLSRHQDFPQTPEAIKTMRQRVEKLVGDGVPFGNSALDMAYIQLVSEGVISPVEKEDEKETAAPPRLGGSGGGAGVDDAKVEAMSDKDLEALLRKNGMLR